MQSAVVAFEPHWTLPEVMAGEVPLKGRDGDRINAVRVAGAKYGATFGSALAIVISYTTNHSILWAIIDGIFSWLYVIYFALFEPECW